MTLFTPFKFYTGRPELSCSGADVRETHERYTCLVAEEE